MLFSTFQGDMATGKLGITEFVKMTKYVISQHQAGVDNEENSSLPQVEGKFQSVVHPKCVPACCKQSQIGPQNAQKTHGSRPPESLLRADNADCDTHHRLLMGWVFHSVRETRGKEKTK